MPSRKNTPSGTGGGASDHPIIYLGVKEGLALVIGGKDGSPVLLRKPGVGEPRQE
jgi:hypothetical protein